jgi:hypothetical protein
MLQHWELYQQVNVRISFLISHTLTGMDPEFRTHHNINTILRNSDTLNISVKLLQLFESRMK